MIFLGEIFGEISARIPVCISSLEKHAQRIQTQGLQWDDTQVISTMWHQDKPVQKFGLAGGVRYKDNLQHL